MRPNTVTGRTITTGTEGTREADLLLRLQRMMPLREKPSDTEGCGEGPGETARDSTRLAQRKIVSGHLVCSRDMDACENYHTESLMPGEAPRGLLHTFWSANRGSLANLLLDVAGEALRVACIQVAGPCRR